MLFNQSTFCRVKFPSLCLFFSVSLLASAQPAPAVKSSATIQLVTLGTGGGPPLRLQRSEPCTLLLVGNRRYLIDVGVGSLRRLLEAGYSASEIDAVIITHHHLDHDGGLADFISYSSFEGREKEVPIVGPYATTQMVHYAIAYSSASRRIFGSEGFRVVDPNTIYHGHDISNDGIVFEDGVIRVKAVENSHYRLIRPGTPSYGLDKSYSCRVETPQITIVFTGDTGPSKPLVKLAEGADVLVSEVINVPASVNLAISHVPSLANARIALENHMTNEHLLPEEVGKLATQAGVKRVILYHLSPGRDNSNDSAVYTDGVKKFYHGSVVLSQDLQKFALVP